MKFMIISVAVFLIDSIGGNISGLMNNDACYKLLGCNFNFFGYDAFVHFTSGIAAVALLLYLMDKFPALDLRTGNYWKDILIITVCAVTVGACWEIGEFAIDNFKVSILHKNLLYPVNRYYQTSNADTMGDLTFGSLGAWIAAYVAEYVRNRKSQPSAPANISEGRI